MLTRIADSDVHLYVYDSKVFHEISNVNDVKALQGYMNDMLDWVIES